MVTLLEHRSMNVRTAVLNNLAEILWPSKDAQDALAPILSCLLKAGLNCKKAWRVQEQMVLQSASLCSIFDSSQVGPQHVSLAYLPGSVKECKHLHSLQQRAQLELGGGRHHCKMRNGQKVRPVGWCSPTLTIMARCPDALQASSL